MEDKTVAGLMAEAIEDLPKPEKAKAKSYVRSSGSALRRFEDNRDKAKVFLAGTQW